MLKNKILLTSSIMSFCVATPALAVIDGWTTASINARNAALQQNYMTLRDDYDIWVNPAWIGNYSDRAYASLGTYIAGESSAANNASNPNLAGGNLATAFGDFGFYIGRTYTGPLQFNVIGTGAGLGTLVGGPPTPAGDTFNGLINPVTLGISAPPNRFDLFYGRDLSGVKAGLRLNVDRYSRETSQPTGVRVGTTTISEDSQSFSATDINISAGVTLKDRPIDAALTFGLPRFSSTARLRDSDGATAADLGEDLKSDGAKSIGVIARGQFFKQPRSFVTATGWFSHENSSLKKASKAVVGGVTIADLNGELGDITNTYGVAGSFNLTPGDNVLVVAAARLAYSSNTETTKVTSIGTPTTDTETKTARLMMPIAIGVEAKASNSWTLRGSVSKDILDSTRTAQNDKLATPSGEAVVDGTNAVVASPITVALGFRYTLGGLMIDTVVNRDLFFTGADLLSGIPNTLMAQVSFIYSFE